MFWFISCLFIFTHAERWTNQVSLHKTGYKFLMKFAGRTTKDLTDPAVYFEVEIQSEEPIPSAIYVAQYLDTPESWGVQAGVEDKCGNDGWRQGIKSAHMMSLSKSLSAKVKIVTDETQRPHFWYLAIVNCQKPSQMIEYSVHAWQADEKWWSKEFSYNDRGLNSLYLALLIFYPLLFISQMHSWKLHSLLGAHHIVRLISISIITEVLGIFLTFLSYLHFAKHGRVQIVCFILGGLLMITSSTVFLFVLFLLAQGWIISTDKQPKYIQQMTIGCCAIWMLHCIFFFWRDHSGHSASNLYFYDSPPQSVFALSFAFLGFLFVGFCHQSWMAEKVGKKQKLYIRLGCIYIFYFFVPLFSMILANVLSPWVRDITVRSIYETSHFLFLGVLVCLLHPNVNVLEMSCEEKQSLRDFDATSQESYL